MQATEAVPAQLDATQQAEAQAAVEAQLKAAAEAQAEELKKRSAKFDRYMKDGFGGGDGTPPVSWYHSIGRARFDTHNRLILTTTLASNDDVEIFTAIVTAVRLFDEPPNTLELRGKKGEVLGEWAI